MEREETPHAKVAQIVTGHFREGRRYGVWRSRGTDDFLLIYTVAGRGRFGHQAGEIVAQPGDWVMLRPGTTHDYGTEPGLGRWELLWAHFRPRAQWLALLDWPAEAPGLLRLRGDDPVAGRRAVAALREAHESATAPRRRREEFACNALERALLWCDSAGARAGAKGPDARVREAMEWMCRRMGQRLTLEAMAEHVALSASRFSHLFRAQAGVPPQQFLESQRLARARQLLEMTGRSIKEISREVGFENPFYFSLRFKAAVGKSPRQWREGRRDGDEGPQG